MTDSAYSFEIPKHHKSIIKVIGVGGGGSNAVNHMFNQGIRDVEFIVCNTDQQALLSSPVNNKLQIGANLTKGLGAGGNPEKGCNAALESKEEIRELLSDDTKMVFITAGMGGGTGTGAAPVIARVAKELDILTVGIVTGPFSFEGKKKMEQALTGISQLKESCDTVLVILNDKLREIYGNLSISSAFAQADNVLTTAAKGIAEIITVPGYVNVDFEDVKTVMYNSGTAVMGSAHTEGEDRAKRAAEMALASPLLNNRDIHGAEKVLLSIISGEEAELQMDELTEITDYITEMAGDSAEVIFGHGVDADLGESIRVTVIATGFDNKEHLLKVKNVPRVIDLESNRTIKEPTQQMSMFSENTGEETTEVEEKTPMERTYIFERPMDKASADDPLSKHSVGVDEEDELLKELSGDQEEDISFEEKEALEVKKAILKRQAIERKNKLQGLKSNTLTEEDYKQRYDQPAYLRRNIKLQNIPHSSDEHVSKYNLNDDNQIVGNNRFLHDNVD